MTEVIDRRTNGWLQHEQHPDVLRYAERSEQPSIIAQPTIETKLCTSQAQLTPSAVKLPKVPRGGVWAPTITFFDHSQDTIDTVSQSKYFAYLSKTGLAGLVVLGSNAEAFLLTREERKLLLQTARSACGPSFPIMAGVDR